MKLLLILVMAFTLLACNKEKNSPGCWICDIGGGLDTSCGNSEDDVKSRMALDGVINPSREIFEKHCHKR